MNREKLSDILFWVNLVGCCIAGFLARVVHGIPQLQDNAQFFMLGACGFAVGMIANYLILPKEKQPKK